MRRRDGGEARGGARHAAAVRRPALALAAACVLAGCAVGPDYHRPELRPPARYGVQASPAVVGRGTDAQHFLQQRDVPARWWELFGSPAIDHLVDAALQHNPDLAAAQAALRQAHETTAAARGGLLPSVALTAGVTREQDAGTLSPTLSSAQPLFSLQTAAVSVSYSLDLFGLNRRQIESLAAQETAQRYELEATYQSLVANVVLAAIQRASLAAQLRTTQQTLQSMRATLRIMQRQRTLGLIATSDVNAQRGLVATADMSCSALRKQLEQQDDLLAQLTGSYPGASDAAAVPELAQIHLPHELPLSLPAHLVNQRPDVLMAEAGLHAATAQLGVADAQLLPDLSLTATAGSVATQIDQLLHSGTIFWSAGTSLSQTLFAGGALIHHRRAAVAALDQAGAQYRSVVLNAFRDVADTLSALQWDARSLEAAATAQQAAAANVPIVQREYGLGAVSYLGLLTAQQTRQQAQITALAAQAAQLADTVALFQSLGGGWWNRPPQS